MTEPPSPAPAEGSRPTGRFWDPEPALRRYRDIVDDYEGFIASASKPLSRAVWVNSLRGDADALSRRVAELAPEAVPVPWRPHTWRLPPGSKPGKWLEYALGLVHTQEEISLWPAMILDAQPGETVIDLCASPGNKTAHLALAMQDRGTLVANEHKFSRLTPLGENLSRLGLTSTIITWGDGRQLAWPDGSADRVLVDVPCTCEGTSRKSGGRIRQPTGKSRRSLAKLQGQLLAKAIDLAKPGAPVVYSTCTYAPEENEAVLDSIPRDRAVIEPIEVPTGLVATPGLTEWQEQTYRPDVANARRLWPHHNDTGGFFVARLRRV